MPFGINSAPEIWQRTMNQLVEGLTGTEVIHDDSLIVGCDTTDKEAEKDHDKNLRTFLDRARERNLRLNAEKMKLKMTEVPYVGGHLLTREGLRVDPKKVEAIEKMPEPGDAKAVQRLLGSVNYLAKFVPHLSDILSRAHQYCSTMTSRNPCASSATRQTEVLAQGCCRTDSL